MKTITFDTYSELIGEVVGMLENKDSTSVFCDYQLANMIKENISTITFNKLNIELDEDIDEYYVDRARDILYIFPARCTVGDFEGKLLVNEANNVIIIEDSVGEMDEVLEAYEGLSNITIMDYKKYDIEEDCECEFCTQEKYVDRILNEKFCPQCASKLVQEIWDEAIEFYTNDLNDED